MGGVGGGPWRSRSRARGRAVPTGARRGAMGGEVGPSRGAGATGVGAQHGKWAPRDVDVSGCLILG